MAFMYCPESQQTGSLSFMATASWRNARTAEQDILDRIPSDIPVKMFLKNRVLDAKLIIELDGSVRKWSVVDDSLLT